MSEYVEINDPRHLRRLNRIPALSKDRTKAENYFDHGTLGDEASLNIDVQFNLPIAKQSRQSGVAFLRHVPTGRIVLAHRGIVTRGHGRVRRSIFFAEIVTTLLEADTGNGTNEFCS